MQNNAFLAGISRTKRNSYSFCVLITSLFFLLNPIQAQERAQPIINATISGTVTDSITREPLEGALVQLESVTHSVATDRRGNFKFVTGQKLPATLIISYLGYQDARIVVNNSPVNIALTPSFNELTDVVITGYGSQSKQLYTGSASQISATSLEEKPAQSFDQLLSGQAAGINMVQPSGALNSTPVFRIRGINSITSSIYPLIIVDGVTVFTGSAGGAVGNNPLADINPNDIETIDVLKDASATAIYGSRAANGVVVITTKKGKKGSSKVTYSGSVSFSTPYNLPELLNATDYVAIKNEARQNAGLEQGFALGQNADGSITETDWYDIAYQTGVSQNHNISISGANNATSYYFAANFTEQNSIIKTNTFDRKGIRINADHNLNELITFGINANYSNSFNAGHNTGAIGPNSIASSSGTAVNSQYIGLQPLARLTYILPPNVSVYNPDGSYNINSVNGNIGHGPNDPTVGVFNAYNLQTILDL